MKNETKSQLELLQKTLQAMNTSFTLHDMMCIIKNKIHPEVVNAFLINACDWQPVNNMWYKKEVEYKPTDQEIMQHALESMPEQFTMNKFYISPLIPMGFIRKKVENFLKENCIWDANLVIWNKKKIVKTDHEKMQDALNEMKETFTSATFYRSSKIPCNFSNVEIDAFLKANCRWSKIWKIWDKKKVAIPNSNEETFHTILNFLCARFKGAQFYKIAKRQLKCTDIEILSFLRNNCDFDAKEDCWVKRAVEVVKCDEKIMREAFDKLPDIFHVLSFQKGFRPFKIDPTVFVVFLKNNATLLHSDVFVDESKIELILNKKLNDFEGRFCYEKNKPTDEQILREAFDKMDHAFSTQHFNSKLEREVKVSDIKLFLDKNANLRCENRIYFYEKNEPKTPLTRMDEIVGVYEHESNKTQINAAINLLKSNGYSIFLPC